MRVFQLKTYEVACCTRLPRLLLVTETPEKPGKYAQPHKEHMAKKSTSKAKAQAAPKPAKITASTKPRSKGDFYTTIADATQLSRKQIGQVFETMGRIISVDLSKQGSGVCNVAGLMKVMVVRKPATKARKGINPFTKQEVMFKAKPARNVVKIRPLKTLKSMV
jgi:nucleoid DNA-binding protein